MIESFICCLKQFCFRTTSKISSNVVKRKIEKSFNTLASLHHIKSYLATVNKMVGVIGLEPMTSCL